MRHRQSHVWAVGLAVGLLWAWFPKDNLFSLALILVAIGYRPPWLAVLAGLPIGAVVSLLLEPTALWLGERLLETHFLLPLLTWVHNQPVLPWLGLNSSLMLGILSLSSWLIVPGYWLARELIEQLAGESVESRQRAVRPGLALPNYGATAVDSADFRERSSRGREAERPSPVSAGDSDTFLRWDEPQPTVERLLHRRAATAEPGLMLSDVLRWAPEDAQASEHEAAVSELPERLLELEELLAEGESELASLGSESISVEPDFVEQDVFEPNAVEQDAGQRALLVIDTALDILRLDDSVAAGVPVPLGVTASPRSATAPASSGAGDDVAVPPAASPQTAPVVNEAGQRPDLQQRIDRPVSSGDDRDAALPFLLGHLQRHRSVREDA